MPHGIFILNGYVILSFRFKIELPVYLNQGLSFYHLLGLKRHCLVLSVRNLGARATIYLETGQLPRDFDGEDWFQEGGDFIISKAGKVEYAYVAEGTVRPAVLDIVGCLKKLQNS